MQFGTFLVCSTLAIASLSATPQEVPQAAECMTNLCQMDSLDFRAQVDQDKFVYMLLYGMLGKKDPGYYLEIGAGEPIYINNSYVFEKNLNWEGASIEISEHYFDVWRTVRDIPLHIGDATQVDYNAILQPFPKVIDYLSLDIDGRYTDVLRKIPFDEYTFKIITIEHDHYRYGDLYRLEEREILESLGYFMLCPDVSYEGSSFEDWWIHPSFFTSSEMEMLTALNLKGKNYQQLIETIRAALTQNAIARLRPDLFKNPTKD